MSVLQPFRADGPTALQTHLILLRSCCSTKHILLHQGFRALGMKLNALYTTLRLLKASSAATSACCSAAPLNLPGGRRLIRRLLKKLAASRSALELDYQSAVRRPRFAPPLIRGNIRPVRHSGAVCSHGIRWMYILFPIRTDAPAASEDCSTLPAAKGTERVTVSKRSNCFPCLRAPAVSWMKQFHTWRPLHRSCSGDTAISDNPKQQNTRCALEQLSHPRAGKRSPPFPWSRIDFR
jgi:hypothetical protein